MGLIFRFEFSCKGEIMFSRKYLSGLLARSLFLLILLLLIACAQPEPGPEPLKNFYERVTALVTTSIRGQLRDNLPKQKLLSAQLPSLQKKGSMGQVMEELKEIDYLKDLAYILEADIMFELQKPENHYEKNNFNSPEIQRELASGIIAGMKRALHQLKGGKDGT